MTEALDRVRVQLLGLIDGLERDLRDIEAQRDAEAAEAIEAATCAASAADAYRQGRQDERQRCLALVKHYGGQLRQAGLPSGGLATLRQAIEGS